MDLSKIIGGSAIAKYRGLELETSNGITTDLSLETWDVSVDGISESADKRVKGHGFKITLTPAGKWVNPDRLYPYIKMPPGRLITPVLEIAAVDGGAHTFTIKNHQLYTADRVMIGLRPGATLPALSAGALDLDTWYFVSVIDPDTVKIHPTAANALAGTGALALSAAGTGVAVLVGQFPLEIYGQDGERITFHNVAITKQPDFDGTLTKTPFGQVEFTAFLRNRMHTEQDQSYYTVDEIAFPGFSISDTDIITQAQQVSYADQLVIAQTAINTGTEDITAVAHGRSTGDVVYFGTVGALPGAVPAINPEIPLYIHKIDADTFTLHTNSVDAGTGANAINFTSEGTGPHILTVDNPPVSLIETKTGVQCKFPANLENRMTDRDQLITMRLVSAEADATLLPIGLGASNILALLNMQGSTAPLGRSLGATAKSLNIFSAGMFLQLNKAVLNKGGLVHNMKDDRAKELTFMATRTVKSGVLSPVAVVDVAPPLS